MRDRTRRPRSRLSIGRWFAHAALAGALIVACTGHFGDGGGLAGGGGAGPTASSSGTGSSGNGSASGGTPAADSGSPATDSGVPAIPFEPFSVPVSVTKVKTVLTGMAPTQAEIDAVTADASALGGLVTGWMHLPQYQAKMETFFADAFQQSQCQDIDFAIAPFQELLLNDRQGFAKTVTELIAEGRPFTETVTTTRYMMTTAMMTQYAFDDVEMFTDATAKTTGDKHCRYFDVDPSWGFKLTAASIPLADSGNPASPNYLTFSIPSLATQYSKPEWAEQDAPAGSPPCGSLDPVIEKDGTIWAGGVNLCATLLSVMTGTSWRWTPPGQSYVCTGGSGGVDHPSYPRMFTASDYSDWRMVTITQAKGTQDEARFFDIVGNRASNTLALFQQRVGYFTTPSFFAQYPTNVSNQGRVTADQTMIVGLGRAFDGTDTITVRNAPGVDVAHASNPACFQCHWSLDPMARFFRSNLTTNYSEQQDPAQKAITGTFLFENVVANSDSSLYYLANQMASHPRFKTAWTQKLCAWANSAPCLENDPEVVRVAQVFASSNYDWNALVHELFTSPLVTYASPTQSTQATGTIVPIARRGQLCATLGNRLGLGDVCGQNFIPLQFNGGGYTVPIPQPPSCSCMGQGQILPCTDGCPDPGPVPPAAAGLPVDGYSRGSAEAQYITAPDPFWRSALEQVCAYVADVVVDAGTSPVYSSATPNAVTTSIASMVHGLMGLDSSRDAEPIGILTSDYMSALGAGSTPTVALKSTFTAACLSPAVAAVGE